MLDRQLQEIEAAAPEAPPPPVDPTIDAGTTAQRLAKARADLASMLLRLTVDHPDVQRQNRTIRELEKTLEAEALEAPVSAGREHLLTPAEQQRQRRLADVRAQMEQLDRQTTRNLNNVEQLRKVVAEYQRRAESGPTRETEMVELNRDYATLQGVYTGLLSKKEQANLAGNLERRQIGEQFKVIDPARLPQSPVSPNRRQIGLAGMVAGLTLGLALVALLEYRNVGLQSDEEIASVLALPVLAVVPHLEAAAERRRRARYRLVLNFALGGTVFVCLVVVVYVFFR
jgi:uncharacterized protein involved in exopolysaccharide biosynthesis